MVMMGLTYRKSSNWVSPRHKAIKKFYAYLRSQGVNLDWETVKRLYVDLQKEFPRFRAKEMPSRGTLDRIEVIASDQYGPKIIMESGKPEWAQRVKRKRMWKELGNFRTRAGTFSFRKRIKGDVYGLAFMGGSHKAFLVFTPYMLPLVREVYENLRRKSKGKFPR
jgi:hypothetical protein